MKTLEYRTADKSEWGAGPWQEEPDKMQWQDEATGLPCLIVRNTWVTGSLCGYVGVPSGHPLYGQPPSNAQVAELDAHGPINYADFCQDAPEEKGICHAPEPGDPANVYWFGFDCARAFDACPKMDARLREIAPDLEAARAEFEAGLSEEHSAFRMVYRDVAYVRAQCVSLAAQLAAHSKES